MESALKRFSFQPGKYVRIDDRVYLITLHNPEQDRFTLLEQESGAIREHSRGELHALLGDGRLEFVSFLGEQIDLRRQPRTSESLSAMSEKRRARVEFRLSVIEAIDQLEPGTLFERETRTDRATGEEITAFRIEHEIADACKLTKRKPVTFQTYYNWKKLLKEDGDVSALAGKFEMRGRNAYLDPETAIKLREALATAVELAKAKKHIGAKARITPTKIIKLLRDELPEEKLPSRSYVHQAIQALPAYDRTVALKGARAADKDFRMASRAERPAACLDSVEYDETRLKLVLVDEQYGVALGTPYLSWYVDVYSDAPIGFYVGYEPMSDVSTMAALRHACLPKSYMRSEYPGIAGTIPAGIARSITFDNGLSEHGDTIQAAARDIGCDIRYAPPYRAWFKGAVEGMHETLNRLLLEDQAGFVLRPENCPGEYDPAEQACLGMRQFVRILHHWIADRYMMTPTGPFHRRPTDKWAEGTREVQPTFLARAQDVDLVFGILRPGNLDHRGVRFANLFYLSDDMARFRRRHGASLSVDVKVGPHMGRIHWRGPDGVWRPADAVFYEYAWGRTLYNHEVVQAQARKRTRGDELAGLLATDRALRKLAREAFSAQLGVRQNKRIARAFGLGTETLLANQQTDGSLPTPALTSLGKASEPLVSAPPTCSPRLKLTRFATERRGE